MKTGVLTAEKVARLLQPPPRREDKKAYARKQVAKAVQDGTLDRPDTCSECGKKWYDIEWTPRRLRQTT